VDIHADRVDFIETKATKANFAPEQSPTQDYAPQSYNEPPSDYSGYGAENM
jgi:hypothetical protein